MQYSMLFRIGYPIRDLSRRYRDKLQDLLEDGYKIHFSKDRATQALTKTILKYFLDNNKVHFL